MNCDKIYVNFCGHSIFPKKHFSTQIAALATHLYALTYTNTNFLVSLLDKASRL